MNIRPLLVSLILLAPSALKAQMISPKTGGVYTTPVNINVQLTNGCLINQLFLYKYRTDAAGVEHLEYFRTGPVLGNTTNAYVLNPDSGYWNLSCDDYNLKVAYTLDGTNYSVAWSGKIRILTDRATITIKYPTPQSVLIRGQAVNIRWDALTKPGQEGMSLSLITPDHNNASTVAELGLNGETPVTNQFAWTVVTNTSYNGGTVQVPDGYYILQVMPANSYGMSQVGFAIDSQQTIQPNLAVTDAADNISIAVNADQFPTRFWTLQRSDDFVNWIDTTNTAVWNGLSFTVPKTLGNQFFRAKSVP